MASPRVTASPGPLEAALLSALAAGPAPAWRLGEALAVSVDRVIPLLKDMRARALVVSEPDGQGVRTWRLAP